MVFTGPFARARIGPRPLAAHRHSLAVPQAAIAAEIHQALDVHGDDAAQIAFDPVIAVDTLANAHDLVVGQLRHPPFGRNADLGADLPAFARPMPWM